MILPRPPQFWHRPGSWVGACLSPLGIAYGLMADFHQAIRRRRRQKAAIPVICVGNVVLGGAGKTPTVQAIVRFLQKQGATPHILLRGYGRQSSDTLRVDKNRHTYQDVGDEALILAQDAPTWVGADRVKTARLAQAAGADCLVLDDGLQNPTLHHDYRLLVIDRDYGVGNGYLFPAGPLRQHLGQALKSVHAVILTGGGSGDTKESVTRPGGQKSSSDLMTCLLSLPHTSLMWDYTLGGEVVHNLHGPSIVAFAGIGRPDKFFNTILDLGGWLVETHPFPDHHPYMEHEIAFLIERAKDLNACLMTTEKDYYRLPPTVQGVIDVLKMRPHLPDDFLMGHLWPAIRDHRP